MRYSIFPRKVCHISLSALKSFSDYANLGFREFGQFMRVSAAESFWMEARWIHVATRALMNVRNRPASIAACLPAFPVSVGHIIFVCSNPKMRRIAATWIVARVTDPHPARNLTADDCERNAMGFKMMILPVTPFEFTGSPNPARTKLGPMGRDRAVFIYLCPESVLSCFARKTRAALDSFVQKYSDAARFAVSNVHGVFSEGWPRKTAGLRALKGEHVAYLGQPQFAC